MFWNRGIDSNAVTALETEYSKDTRRKVIIISVLLLILFVTAGFSLTRNALNLGFWDPFKIIFDRIIGTEYAQGSDEWVNDLFICNIYLPRIVLAVFLGAGLAICGVAMQSVMNNPLADSYTTGISDGACFGAVVAIVMGFTFSETLGSMGIVVNAFVGGLIPAIILITLSNIIKMSPATMILVGIALSYIFSGMEAAIMVVTDPDTLTEAYLWQIGTLGDIQSWNQCYIPMAACIIGSAILWMCSNKLNLLSLGDDSAKSLGLDVQTFKTVIMIIVSVVVATLVSYVGIVGFVGLICPHIARIFFGGNNLFLIPSSALVGAVLISVADLISRTIISPDELRLGAIISMIGAPIFLYIILSRKKSYGEVYRWNAPHWKSSMTESADGKI